MTDVVLLSKEAYDDTVLMDELMSIMGFYELPNKREFRPYKFVKINEKAYASNKLSMDEAEFGVFVYSVLAGYNDIDRSKKEIIDHVLKKYECNISSIATGSVYNIIVDNGSDRLVVLPGRIWKIA